MSLSPIVLLYRAAGCPPYEKGGFHGVLDFEQHRSYFIQADRERVANFFELVVDGVDYDDPRSLPPRGVTISFLAKPSTKNVSTFHADISSLIAQDPKIAKGEAPSDFYLLEEDYYDCDAEQNDSVDRLKKVCSFVKALSFLAHYHDEKSKGNFLRLVFIRPDEIGVSKPVVLETHLDSEILSSVAKLNLEQMDGLCNSSEVEDSHYRERIGIFGNTLVEFVGQQVEPREAFALLVKNWRKFFESYQRNLAVYLSGFAFHKAKREVAQAEIDVSSKLSKIVGDISGKLLSIPVSLAAIVAIPRSDNVIIGALVVIGLLLGGFIVSHVIRNQSSQLARVVHSKEMIFSSIEGRKDVYPEDLVADIDQIKAALDEDVERLKSLLVIFSWLCWLPFTVAMLVHLYFCFAWFC